MRVHADLHLGRLLVADDGYRVIDFEGEPLRPFEDRRRPIPRCGTSPRCCGRWTTSPGTDAAGPTPGRGAIERPGLDIDAWIPRARARFLAAYAGWLRRSGVPVTLDRDLLDAFEVAREVREFVYAATVMPSWFWAPREGMRWLLEHGEPA